jgi:hypothetical protein
MIYASMFQIRKHRYSGDFNFTILFVVVSLYIINLDDVSLFADPLFTFLAKLKTLLYLIYSINFNDE